MKAGVYFILFLLIIPFQASLLNPLSLAGIKPDLALALLYIIGLVISPLEATIVGIGTGLLLDIGSVSLIGLTGFTRGLVGLFASLLGKKVLDVSSPSNGIFLAGFSLLEGIGLMLFMQIFYEDLPFFGLVAGRILPQAIYTGVLGVVLLQFMAGKNVLAPLMRRTVQKEL
jgi:cell shape-determining protein MreD